MNKYTLRQARYMSGISDSDSEIEQDLKLGHWLGRRRYAVVDHDTDRVPPDTEVVIVRLDPEGDAS